MPLSPLALELIEQQRAKRRQDAGLLFPSDRRDSQPITVGTKIVEEVRRTSGIADFTAHHLRRTVSTGITRLGFGRFVADKVLNHVERGVGRRYDRYEYLKEKTEALEAWAQQLEIITGDADNVVRLRKDA